MTGGNKFESTDDCKVAAWWQDKAGECLTMEPFQRDGEAGGDVVRLWPELDTDTTSADVRPMFLRLGEGTAMLGVLELVVELHHHRRRLQPLAVKAMLTESKSLMWLGER